MGFWYATAFLAAELPMLRTMAKQFLSGMT
jgi:hypothetical protein